MPEAILRPAMLEDGFSYSAEKFTLAKRIPFSHVRHLVDREEMTDECPLYRCRLQLWREKMNDGQSHEISRAGNDEDRHVTTGALENLAHNQRNEHAANCASHTAYTDD